MEQIRVICCDDKIKEYMQKILVNTINSFCNGLNLSLVKCIKVVDRGFLPLDVDARTENDEILISKESIVSSMTNLSIQKINDYFCEREWGKYEQADFLVNNIFHELCHANAKYEMPNLHAIIYNPDEEVLRMCIAHYWIEFLVEYESYKEGLRQKSEFQDSFVYAKWNIKYFRMNRNDMSDMFWLMYTISYFIGLCYAHNNFDYYVNEIKDTNLQNLCIELYDTSVNLYQEMPFDDYDRIHIFKRIFEKYWDSRRVRK